MSSTIRIAILANGQQASRELSQMDRRVRTSISGFTGLGDKIRVGMRVGATAIAGAGVAAGVGALTLVNYAAKLELMDKKARVVFGSTFPQMEAWAGKVGTRMGLTTRQTLAMAAGIQDLLVPMGFTRDTAGAMTQKLAGLSGALAEWSGGTRSATEVGDILSAALLGERDALQGLGIGISQAQVDAQVLTNKKRGLKFATDEQAQAQATLDLIMAKSTDAQKAYAAGAGSLAAQVSSAKAKLGNMRDELVVRVTPALLATAKWIEKNKDSFVHFGQDVATWSLRIGAALLGIMAASAKLDAVILHAAADMVRAFAQAISGVLGLLSHLPFIGEKFKTAKEAVDRFGASAVTKLETAARGADKVAASSANAAKKALELASGIAKIKNRAITIGILDRFTASFNNIITRARNEAGRAISITVGTQRGPGAKGNATGTRSAAQGWSWVGEQGPELVNFRGGEQVVDAVSSKSMGGDVNVTLTGGDPLMQAILSIVDARVERSGRTTAAAARAGTGKARVR